VHISGCVLVDATQQTDQRTSQMGYLFFAEALLDQTGTFLYLFKNNRRGSQSQEKPAMLSLFFTDLNKFPSANGYFSQPQR